MIQEPNPLPHLSSANSYEAKLDSLPTIRTSQNRPIVINLKSNQRILVITTNPIQATQNQVQSRKNPIIISRRKHVQSVPFLPRSEPTTLSVKKNLPIKKNLNLLNNIVDTPLSGLPNTQLIETPTVNTRTNETDTRHHHNHLTCKPVHLTGHNSNTNYSFKNYCSEYTAVSSPPLQSQPITTTTTTTARPATLKTLTTMAGIQLTGADESLLDMSGAMPTATVEEINVPVFIDEYLQLSTPTTSTTTTEATTIFSNSNNNNNYNSNGNDFCIKDDEEFEFDIDMIAKGTGPEVLQTLYYNNSNNDSSNSCCNNNSTSNNNNNIYNTPTSTNYDEMNTSNTVKFENDDSYEMFLPDPFFDLDETMDEPILAGNEEAIDFNTITNETMTLDSVIISSQNDPWLCDDRLSANNSQPFSIADAQPVVQNCDENDITIYDSPMPDYDSQYVDGAVVKIEHLNQCKAFKSKLSLNTSLVDIAKSEELLTPAIIEQFADMNGTQEFPLKTVEQILAGFSEPTPVNINTYDEAPCTPQSCASSYTHLTNHTDCTTSPNSPAFSINSSDTTSRKKRGRPSKMHSDPIPLEELQKLTPAQRKRREDREKNNEASRVSRQKNKKREEAEIIEETELIRKNDILESELKELQWKEKKFKNYLLNSRK